MQCAEEQRHVPESLYPFTYNPKMSLNLSQVPISSQRSPPSTRTQLKDIAGAKDDKVGQICNLASLYYIYFVCRFKIQSGIVDFSMFYLMTSV